MVRADRQLGLNLGPVSSAWLAHAGIHSLDDLRRQGAVAAYLKVQALGYRVSLNLLWALAGAMLHCPWNRLPAGERERLLLELDVRQRQPDLDTGITNHED